MPFNKPSLVFKSSIKPVEIGTGEKKITLGGENVYPLYSFDAPIENRPRVGIQISDLGLEGEPDCIREYYGNESDITELAKKAAAVPGADFLCVAFESADPGSTDRPVEECVETAKKVAEAVDLPLVFMGCKNAEKDAQLFVKISEALAGRNILVLSAKEENYKTVGVSVAIAGGNKLGAESSVDINLAKQLNVLLSQLNVKPESVVMNIGTAAAGYGFEYVVSTMDRIEAAALSQNDNTLQMPIITPLASETWGVKEALASEEDYPDWGSQEQRGIDMEVVTATSCIASGSNAVILKHPVSVATVSKLINELM